MPRDPRQAATQRLRTVSANRRRAEAALVKLRASEVREIHASYSVGVTQAKIARECRLSPQRIAQILRRTVPTPSKRAAKR
jgi:hypothetical protein